MVFLYKLVLVDTNLYRSPLTSFLLCLLLLNILSFYYASFSSSFLHIWFKTTWVRHAYFPNYTSSSDIDLLHSFHLFRGHPIALFSIDLQIFTLVLSLSFSSILSTLFFPVFPSVPNLYRDVLYLLV